MDYHGREVRTLILAAIRTQEVYAWLALLILLAMAFSLLALVLSLAALLRRKR